VYQVFFPTREVYQALFPTREVYRAPLDQQWCTGFLLTNSGVPGRGVPTVVYRAGVYLRWCTGFMMRRGVYRAHDAQRGIPGLTVLRGIPGFLKSGEKTLEWSTKKSVLTVLTVLSFPGIFPLFPFHCWRKRELTTFNHLLLRGRALGRVGLSSSRV